MNHVCEKDIFSFKILEIIVVTINDKIGIAWNLLDVKVHEFEISSLQEYFCAILRIYAKCDNQPLEHNNVDTEVGQKWPQNTPKLT